MYIVDLYAKVHCGEKLESLGISLCQGIMYIVDKS